MARFRPQAIRAPRSPLYGRVLAQGDASEPTKVPSGITISIGPSLSSGQIERVAIAFLSSNPIRQLTARLPVHSMRFRVKNLLVSLFGEAAMPQYVIEREIPGAGNLSDAELQAVARKSVGVLKDMGPEIKWLHSYVTGDKIYCVYLAPDEETVREHARRGGFPANRVSAVRRLIDPDTAN
jgi:Protein of unknown function (DUF4242)